MFHPTAGRVYGISNKSVYFAFPIDLWGLSKGSYPWGPRYFGWVRVGWVRSVYTGCAASETQNPEYIGYAWA